jgi:cytoplasmic iron level regulating protein YaaA (DUF328/UPF0246 family)
MLFRVFAVHLRSPDHTMLALLSPAKDLNMEPMPPLKGATQPVFLEQSSVLMEKLRQLSPKQLEKLMGISPALAKLNHDRNQAWAPPFGAKNAKPAVFAFNGEAYRGLNAATLEADDLRFAQHHLRILSGLYGILRPLDLMQAYRLEMGSPFSAGRGMKDLYAFWGDTIQQAVAHALKESGSDVLVNLASSEYVKAVRATKLGTRVITPVFKDKVNGDYRMLMVFAKHQRGGMARWIIRNRVLEPERLKAYDVDGYRFAADLSKGDEWTFVRERR